MATEWFTKTTEDSLGDFDSLSQFEVYDELIEYSYFDIAVGKHWKTGLSKMVEAPEKVCLQKNFSLMDLAVYWSQD